MPHHWHSIVQTAVLYVHSLKISESSAIAVLSEIFSSNHRNIPGSIATGIYPIIGECQFFFTMSKKKIERTSILIFLFL